MRSALALAARILQQFKHDPRTIAMFILAPILVLWLFSIILGGGSYEPRLAGVDLPVEVSDVLEKQDATYESLDAETAAERLANQEIDAIITLDNGILQVEVEGTDTSRTAAVMAVINGAVKEVATNQQEELSEELKVNMEELSGVFQQMVDALKSMSARIAQTQHLLEAMEIELPPMGEAPALPELPDISDSGSFDIADFEKEMLISDVEISYLHGSDDWKVFDYFGPVFIGMFIFIFVFITSGMSLITERTGGTMERLLVTPIKPWQLVLGFCLGFGLVSIIQASIVLWASVALVGFPNEGSLLTVVCVTVSLALVSLTLGLLVSGLARTPFQVIQFMLILVFPQVLLSGIFDLSQAPDWMQLLSEFMPITYGTEAMREVMLRGASFTDIGLELAILWAFIAVFFALACISFRRRKTS